MEGWKQPVVVDQGEEAIRRTESLDSLIPRSRFNTATPEVGGVIKTTTIQVTVSLATNAGKRTENTNGLVLRPADGVVTASARGRARGAGVPLKELGSLPDSNSGQGGSTGNV